MVPGDTLFTNNTCLRVYKYAGTGLAKTAKSFSLSPVSVRSLARMDKRALESLDLRHQR